MQQFIYEQFYFTFQQCNNLHKDGLINDVQLCQCNI